MVKPAFLTLFWQYFGSSKKYIHNSVVFISKESYAQWNFSLNYPCIRGNLRIHCFPGSLLMFKCCFALYSELFSCLDYFSLVTGEKLILTCGSKPEVMCQIPVATWAIWSSHQHCCCESIRCRAEGISDTEVLLQFSQWDPSQTSLLQQTQTFLLPTQNCLSPM